MILRWRNQSRGCCDPHIWNSLVCQIGDHEPRYPRSKGLEPHSVVSSMFKYVQANHQTDIVATTRASHLSVLGNILQRIEHWRTAKSNPEQNLFINMLRLIEWPWGLNTSSLRQIKQYIVDQTYTHCAPWIIKINEYMNMIEYMYIYIYK